MEICSCFQYLLIVRRASVITQSSLLLTYKDDTFQAGIDDRCTQACKGFYKPYSLTRPTTASLTRLYFKDQSLPQSSGLFCAAV